MHRSSLTCFGCHDGFADDDIAQLTNLIQQIRHARFRQKLCFEDQYYISHFNFRNFPNRPFRAYPQTGYRDTLKTKLWVTKRLSSGYSLEDSSSPRCR